MHCEIQRAVTIDVSQLNEPQGEGVAFGQDNQLYLVSESGGKATGLMTRLDCALLR